MLPEQKPRLKPTANELFGGRTSMETPHVAASLVDRTMTDWYPEGGSADADVLGDLGTMRNRSRDLARNNGLASGAIQTFKDNVIGHQLVLRAMPDYRLLGKDKEWAEEFATQCQSLWPTWANTVECDAGRSMTFLGMTLQALGAAFTNGESLAVPYWLDRPGGKWKTKLMLLEADRLDTPPLLENDPRVRGGVKVDRYGAPVSYYIRKSHPGDVNTLGAEEFVTVPAFDPITGRRRVLHLHDKERTGQSRGKPIVASVLREFRMLGKYGTTELQANIAGSLIAAVLESNLSQEAVAELFTSGSDRLGVAEGDAEGYYRKALGEYQATLKGGAIIPIPVGTKLTGFNPGRPNQAFDSFVTSFLRYIAAGLNLPYELVSKDFSKVNYSSARASLLEAWRHFLGRRRWIKDHWLDPSYGLWMEEAVNSGQLDAPDFYENRYAYTRARWIFSGRGWVDPVKEAVAAKMRIAAGISTHEIECAEQGYDWEEIFEQQARERLRRIDLDLPLSTEGDPQATAPEISETEQSEEGARND